MSEPSLSDRAEKFKLVVHHLLSVYGKAWETQDSALILSAFTPEAIYHERVHEQSMQGHAVIKRYWIEKVINGQSNIQFKVNSIYFDVDASTAIAEWEAEFDDKVKGVRKHIFEIAVLYIQNDQIACLREYWSSKTLAK